MISEWFFRRPVWKNHAYFQVCFAAILSWLVCRVNVSPLLFFLLFNLLPFITYCTKIGRKCRKHLCLLQHGYLEKIQLYWLYFSRQVVDYHCKVQAARYTFEKCPGETRTEGMVGCWAACWHLPMDFQKIILIQKWFALLAEDQTYGFKSSLSQWLMLSQLSNHINLCNPVRHLGASGNSSLCGVSRKWIYWECLYVLQVSGSKCSLNPQKPVTLAEPAFLPVSQTAA